MATVTVLSIQDGNATALAPSPQKLRALQNTDGSLAVFQELEQGGAPLSPLNGLPVQLVGGTSGGPYKETPLGYFELAVTGAVALSSITGGIPSGATYCRIFVEANGVRYRDDGVAPTASIGGGAPLLAGTANFLYAGALAALQFIALAGTANVNVLFYK